ncbi:MAG: PD40 domain-containing protein [Deltaproteobacteria bacterium]|nr:PD40 domain-containing protein [Deltaproteobacteria bacterium]
MGSIDRLRAVEEWNEVSRLEVDGYVSSVSFSPDSRLLASDSYVLYEDRRHTNAVLLWDVVSDRELRRIGNLKDWVTWVAFSPDGALLAWGSTDNTIHLWHISSWRELSCFKGYGGNNFCASFSPDGRFLASGGNDQDCKEQIFFWEIPSGKEVRRLAMGDGGTYWCVAFSPDGRHLASGSNPIGPWAKGDISLILWDVSSGKEVCCLKGYREWITSVSFSPDGKLLASGSRDGIARLWEVSSAKEIWRNKVQSGSLPVESVAFSPDGKILATGSSFEISIWDVSSGRRVQWIHEYMLGTSSVLFSPDGSLLASGGNNAAIVVYKAELSVARVLDYFKQIDRVDANLLEQLIQKYLANGNLHDLAASLRDHGLYEEAAKIYDEISPKKQDGSAGRGNSSKQKPSEQEKSEAGALLCACGETLQSHWKLCPSWGKAVEMMCSCGEPLKAGWKLCPTCGKKISE